MLLRAAPPSTIHFMSSALPSYDEAAAQVAAYAARLAPGAGQRQLAVERVELSQACGRVLARPLCADRDQPPFSRSARDGFACRASEAGTHKPLQIAGATRAGDAPSGPLPPGSAWEIMTGAPVPAGADTVVMVEHVESASGVVRLLPPHNVSAGENIVVQGAQAHAGDELLKAGTEIQPAQVALAAGCGHAVVEVFARPRVAILATGDELVPVASTPGPGQIRNSNGPMLAAMVEAAGGEPWLLPIVADDNAILDKAIALALDADLLLVSGGVSAGKFDLVEPALERAGARFHFTGVRIQPGKPTVFGDFGRAETSEAVCRTQCAFFGLPGNPVSSAVTFLLFASPVLAALAGKLHHGPRFALAVLDGDVKAKPGLTRFLPATCTFSAVHGQLPQVSLVRSEGSGDLAALARSNCFLVLTEDAKRLEAGQTVRILLP